MPSLRQIDQQLERDSYYAATAATPQRWKPLVGDRRCDVAVVGGGLAGLSAALELRQRGFDVVVLEARTCGAGASGRNGGQAIHGLACEMATIEAQVGIAQARRIWAMSLEALDLIRERIASHSIACEWHDGFLSLAVGARKGSQLAAWADRMARVYAFETQRIAADDLAGWIASERFHSGYHDRRSGHLHPLKYCQGLARAASAAGAQINESTPVSAISPGAVATLVTPAGKVRADQVLLAGNVYLDGLVPSLKPRIMPVGTYIACSQVLDRGVADALIPSRSAVCDTNFAVDYFRTTADNRMLYGGLVSYTLTTPRDLVNSMRRRMVATFPQLAQSRIDYTWGGFVDISMNRAPDFGRLQPASRKAPPNVYYLQGFSGHGLALTGLAGKLVAEAMSGDASRFDVFAKLQHRPFPGGDRLRTPSLVLGMAWHRLRELLAG
jgi:gamma-glutamylputrescine oxidase